VADRDAEASIVLEDVLLEEPVAHAPAEEEAVTAVPPGGALPDHSSL
jgi:hypothetical protein